MKLIILAMFCVSITLAGNCDSYYCKECEYICLSNGNSICYDEYQTLKSTNSLPPEIFVIGNGKCTDDYDRKCICCAQRPQQTVCGTDNKTYRNVCELTCVAETNYGILNNLRLQYFGHCRTE